MVDSIASKSCHLDFSFLLLSLALTLVQPALLLAQPVYGGRLVQDDFLYKPGAPNQSTHQDCSPIYLDQCPEFYSLENSDASKPFLDLQPSVQQASPASRDQLPPGVRQGLFQKLLFKGTYLPRLEDDSLGFGDLEASVVFGIPFFRVTAPLLITPKFVVHYLDGPTTPDLPSRVYDAEINFRHLRRIQGGPWAMMAAVTLGQYSDFEKGDADAFRVTGQVFAVYESSRAVQWVMGVVYLNREDLNILPAVGVIYQPTPYVKYEAILPRPRFTWRLPDSNSVRGYERWAYFAGEFGGGIWSIQRRPTAMVPTFSQDLLTYNDYRVVVGVEHKKTGGLSHHLEAGYVFGRKLQFASAATDVRLKDSLFVRLGLTY